MDINIFISTVTTLRTARKEYFRCPYPDLSRKIKSLENKVDKMIREYYEEKRAEEQMSFFVDDN